MATMSFLFVDQVGSTAQLAQLGDDDTRPVRQALFDLLTREIERRGGEIVDNTGDGVMAVFSGAVAAVEAAVSIQHAAAQHNRHSATERELHLRVGVHAGEVTANEQGRWFGMPLVVAARLCALADADAVWTSALVAALVESRTDCRFEDLGPLELKGVGASVSAVSVRWPEGNAAVDLPARLAAARRTPLSGRDDVLARLQSAWQGTVDGSRALVLLAGEPGIGKSRLAAEAAHDAAASGATVVEGSCDEQLPVPFRPFVVAVRQLAAKVGDDGVTSAVGRTPSALARMVPELRAGAASPSTDPQADRLILFEEIDALLAGAGGVGGTLVVLDDLHWADEGTLHLIGHLARSQRRGRLLMVGTYRESDLERNHPLQDLLADLWRTTATERVALGGLDAAAVQSQVAAITGVAAPPATVAQALAAATAGNPFFVEEVARHLVETDRVPQSDEEWAMLNVEELAVPERVRDVVRQRASRLGEAVVDVLRQAAVMGREFSLGVLHQLDRKHPDDVLDLVEQAARARLVQESHDDPDRYRFHHALIRQALYEELSPNRRVRVHRAVAEAMDALPRSDPSEVAHHWGLGAGPAGHPRAIESAELAGALALEALAFERARSEFLSALDQLDRAAPEDDRWRARLLLRLGDSLAALATDREATVAAFTDAAACARRAPDDVALAWAALGLAGPPEGMSQGQALPFELLEEALTNLRASEPAIRVRLLASLGAALSSIDPEAAGKDRAELDERSDHLATESIELARKLDEAEATAFALRARLRTSFDPFALQERLAMAEEVVALGVANRDRSLEGLGLTWKTVALAELGHRTEYAACVERAGAIIAELKDPFRNWMLAARRVTLDLLDGDFDGAEQRCNAYLADYGGTAFSHFVTNIWGNQTFLIRFFQGRLEEVAWMLDLLPPTDSRESLKALIMARAHPEVARETLDGLVARLDDVLALRIGRSARIAMVALAAFEADHRRVAPALRAAVAPYVDTTVVLPGAAGALGQMSIVAGLLAEMEGDLDEAAALVGRALAANEAAENRPMIALARYHAGRLLLEDDPEGGTAVLQQAREEAAAIGMHGLVADSDGLLAGNAAGER